MNIEHSVMNIEYSKKIKKQCQPTADTVFGLVLENNKQADD